VQREEVVPAGRTIRRLRDGVILVPQIKPEMTQRRNYTHRFPNVPLTLRYTYSDIKNYHALLLKLTEILKEVTGDKQKLWRGHPCIFLRGTENARVENARKASMENQNSRKRNVSFINLVVDHWK